MYYKEYGFKITPGNGGKECMGNGTYTDDDGNKIECICDECDFLMCALIKILRNIVQIVMRLIVFIAKMKRRCNG